jgi:hypothetical protein
VPRDIFSFRDGDIFSPLLTTDMQTSKYLAARYLSAPEFFSSGVMVAEYEKLAGSS